MAKKKQLFLEYGLKTRRSPQPGSNHRALGCLRCRRGLVRPLDLCTGPVCGQKPLPGTLRTSSRPVISQNDFLTSELTQKWPKNHFFKNMASKRGEVLNHFWWPFLARPNGPKWHFSSFSNFDNFLLNIYLSNEVSECLQNLGKCAFSYNEYYAKVWS